MASPRLLLAFGVTLFCLTAGAEVTLTNATVSGEYSIGSGPNKIKLTLFANGTFTMNSSATLGDARDASGEWHLVGTRLGLWTKTGKKVFRWSMEAFPRGESVELVPEELLAAYAESPGNLGSCYRKYSDAQGTPPPVALGAASGLEKVVAARREALPAAKVTSPAKEKAKPTAPPAASGPHPLPSSAAPPSEDVVDITAMHSSRGRPVASIEPAGATNFYYKPAPPPGLDANSLGNAGLARLSIDTKGNVTMVKILRSTGQGRFDSEAADTLRRWRANPGAPREVDVSLTSVLSGKRAPVRLQTTSGTMTSG
ncbi:MAG: TonB family protein [Verrucomicrobiota bacterium]|nr:TonB family protein [Verrucomicrobiota bacterium]